MATSFVSLVIALAGFLVGGLIGVSFGLIQRAAKRRNEKREHAGSFKNAWITMPGSMTRVALLMLALVLVQVGCPLLFEGDIQWFVSAGVVLGYGLMLFKELHSRPTAAH